jgi:hypothetical protein
MRVTVPANEIPRRPPASPQPPVCTYRAWTASPLRYNQPDPCLPGLIICRPELAADILKTVATQESWRKEKREWKPKARLTSVF